MHVRGRIEEGYRPTEAECVLSDGRVLGGFENPTAAAMFLRYYSGVSHRLRTARDIFEGAVVGDAYHLVASSEWAVATHPFTPIDDVWTRPDNGQVVFETPGGFRVVPGDRLVLVDDPVSSSRHRSLPSARPCPRVFNAPRAPLLSLPCVGHGEIVVSAFEAETGWAVGWRRDSRQRRGIEGLSLHDHETVAVRAARIASERHLPRQAKRRNRPRDYQRSLVYRWEATMTSSSVALSGIEEARKLAGSICARVGCPPVEVDLGPANLSNHSYYSRLKGIVLQRGMLTRQTLIHEIAHHVVGTLRGRSAEVSHGPGFAAVLLALMREEFGADEEEALRNAEALGVEVDAELLERLSARLSRGGVASPSPSP